MNVNLGEFKEVKLGKEMLRRIFSLRRWICPVIGMTTSVSVCVNWNA